MKRWKFDRIAPAFLMLLLSLTLCGCFGARAAAPAQGGALQPQPDSGRQTPPPDPGDDWQVGTVIEGEASWYGEKFHGRQTANGETYDMYALSAAHKDMPLGSRVRITNLENGRQIELRVNDRGPYVGDRILDLSYAAALELAYAGQGTAHVRAEVLEVGDGKRGGPPVNGSYTAVGPVNPHAVAIAVGTYTSRLKAERIFYYLKGRFRNIKVVELQGVLTVLIGPFSSIDKRRLAFERLRQEGYDVRLID